MMMGEDQEATSFRSTRQRSLPVRLLRATANDLPAWSQLTTCVSPCSAGELPSPCPCSDCMAPKSAFQMSLPLTSRQYNPNEPKKAMTCSPSVTGEFEARLAV